MRKLLSLLLALALLLSLPSPAFATITERKSQEAEELIATDDPAEAGRLIAVYYDSSVDGAPYMGHCAAYYYNLYHE